MHQGILKKWASVLITAAALLITGILLTGCGGSTYDTPREPAIPAATNMAGNVSAEEVCNELLDAGLTNVVIFNDWTADFAGSTGADAGLTDVWVSPEELRPDLVKCADGWEKHHDYSDANCRMTAFLLMDGIITSEKTDKAYDGTYLMFDVDAIENVPRYEVIKKNLALFTTLFGDRTPVDGEEPSEVFGRIWDEYGFHVESDKAHLLSIVLYDPDTNQTFVGHTGVMIQEEGSVLFVEKIAFEQPYQAIRAESIDQLLKILAERPEYFGEEGAPGPFVYIDGEYVRKLA